MPLTPSFCFETLIWVLMQRFSRLNMIPWYIARYLSR